MSVGFAAAVVFLAPLAHVLLSRVPDLDDVPVVSDRLGWEARSVPLDLAGRDGPRITARLPIELEKVDRLLVHQEVWILFATFGERPRLIRSQIRVSDSCRYATRTGARLVDNQYLPFVREGNCTAVSGQPTAPLELTVDFERAERVAVWTWIAPPDVSDVSTQPAVTSGEAIALLRGRYVDRRSGIGPRRVELLSHVWQISERPFWIWTLLAAAAGIVAVGLILFPWSTVPPRAGGAAARAALGGFCFATALGMLYAVVVPPFHAPDEPDHFLSYARLIGDESLPEQAAALARLGHFERIKFHSDEKFRPGDVGRPYAKAWDAHVVAEDVTARSATGSIMYSWLERVVHDRTPPQIILAARLVNACLFGLAVAWGTWLIGAAGGRPFPQLALVPFLLVPTLPFFGMMMSDFAVLTAAFVLLSCCLAALFMDGARSHLLGLALGMVSAVTFASGRGAGPLAVAVAGALMARILLGTRGRATLTAYVGRAALFWGGLGAGIVAFSLLASQAYRDRLVFTLSRGQVAGSDLLSAVLEQPLWLLPVFSAAACLEVVIRAAVRSVHSSGPRRSALAAVIAYGVALSFVLALIVSLFVPLPYLDTLQSSAPSGATDYVARVLLVLGTSVRLGAPDHLLVASFWSGFGWIDTLPPAALTTGLVVISALAGALLLVHLGRTRDTRRIVWLMVMAAAWVGTVSALAAISHAMGTNLHGRYLIGFYASLLAVAWAAPVLLPELGDRGGRMVRWLPAPRSVLLLLVCAAVHAYCLPFVARRYF